jgi:hypothetical protein
MSPAFDSLSGLITAHFDDYRLLLSQAGNLVINVDLNGRVRLVAEKQNRKSIISHVDYPAFCSTFLAAMGAHAPTRDEVFLFEFDLGLVLRGTTNYEFPGWPNVVWVDRLATESDWGHIEPVSTGAPRVVFHSIKGGVGRSTALAVVAAVLAERGHRVMVLDLDLASPGLSSNLIGDDRGSEFGIVDWLVEDLVDNGASIVDSMIVRTNLSVNGDLVVVPAHGSNPGKYISKLGRAWMPKVSPTGRESWSARLRRLIATLEAEHTPDIILVDSRSGIDDISSACVTELGAGLVCMFATNASQTWTGYRVLMEHWQRTGAVREIRSQLKCVGAASAMGDPADHTKSIRDSAWMVFQDHIYDAEDGEEPADGWFNFDRAAKEGPHDPWMIQWAPRVSNFHRWQDVFGSVGETVIVGAFEPLIVGIEYLLKERGGIQ